MYSNKDMCTYKHIKYACFVHQKIVQALSIIANPKIIDVSYQLSTVFSTSLPLENR
jgi:hypothetical protein